MMDLIIGIVKYIVFAIILLVLVGYLSIKEKLPALVPEDTAIQIKEYSLLVLNKITGKEVEKKEKEPIITYKNHSFFYGVVDFLFLRNRYNIVKNIAQINKEKTKIIFNDYIGLLKSLGETKEVKNFLDNYKSDVRRFEVKSFFEKLLKEDKDIVGIELFSLKGKKLISILKYNICVPRIVGTSDFDIFTTKKDKLVFINLEKNIKKGYLRIIYKPSIFKYISLQNNLGIYFFIIDAEKNLVYNSDVSYSPYMIKQMKNTILKEMFPLSIKFDDKKYNLFYSNLYKNFTIIYFYYPTSVISIVLNIILYLFVVFILVVLYLVIKYIYTNIYLKTRKEKVDKEALITGTISEVVKTLKSTAEVTDQAIKEAKSNLEILDKTIEKINSVNNDEESFESNKLKTEWKIIEQ